MPKISLDKRPGRMSSPKYDKTKLGPTATTYPVEKKDERKILSTKKKCLQYNMNMRKGTKYGEKIMRFIDIHKKSKEYLPPFTKYDFTMKQYDKISQSPLKLAYKK